MPNVEHKNRTHLGDNTLISTPDGSGITLDNTSVWGASRLWLQPGEKLNITGGKHFTFTVTGNKHRTNPEPASTVTLSGDMITCGLSIATVAGDKGCTHEECLNQPDMSLRGEWSALDSTFIGNLDIWLEQNNRPSGIASLENLRYQNTSDDKVYERVCFYGAKADYTLWHLLHNWSKAPSVYKATLKVSYMLLTNGATIRRFCAFKDAHIEPNCKCALYYPLLLEGNPLALAYYQRAQGVPKSEENPITQSLPKKHLEDVMQSALLAGLDFSRPWQITVSPERASSMNKLLKVEQFKRAYKRMGVPDISALYTPFEE